MPNTKNPSFVAAIQRKVAERDRAVLAVNGANDALAVAVEAAVSGGVPVTTVATAAGVTRQRIWQMVSRVREASAA